MTPYYSVDAQLNVLALIRNHYDFLERNPKTIELKKMFSPLQFSYEMGTFTFQGFRGFGHTRIVELLFDIYDPILIITPDEQKAKYIQRDLREFYSRHQNKDKIYEDIKKHVIRVERLDTPLGGRPLIYNLPKHYFKMCVVDCASRLNQEQKDLMYNMLSEYVNMFTLLG